MTFTQIDKAFKAESMDLVYATEQQVRAYCDKTGCGDAFSRWLDYQHEVECMYAEMRMMD